MNGWSHVDQRRSLRTPVGCARQSSGPTTRRAGRDPWRVHSNALRSNYALNPFFGTVLVRCNALAAKPDRTSLRAT